jgi:UDP-3-O-[3-hydroxymyristoyl] glucosamine N-acyltransferase
MHKLSDIARVLGLTLDSVPDRTVERVANLEEAADTDLSYINSDRFVDRFVASKAGVILAPISLKLPDSAATLLRVPDAELAIGKVLELFAPKIHAPTPGIHSSAVIADDAVLGDDVSIGPNVTICHGARIGNRTVLCANVFIGQNSSVGDDSILHPNVVLREYVEVGNRVIIHASSVLGTDGFGYRWNGKAHIKIPQIGTVVVEDDVEIGSCTCIDRAKFGQTRVGRGTKIDNLVQIGHNVKIGMHCILCGQAGIAGSTVLGNGVIMGGGSAARDHVKIADGTMVAARGGVGSNTAQGEVLAGFVGINHKQWLREQAALRKLPELIKTVRALQAELEKLKTKTD